MEGFEVLRPFLFRAHPLFVLLLASAACSEGSGGVDPEAADASFTVAVDGGVEEQRWAYAEFEAIDTGQTVGTWELRIHDGSPASFSLTLTRQTQGPPERPAPGTYEIGYRPRDRNVFSAVYLEGTRRGATPTRYVTFDDDVGGTLTISESSEDSVTGTFELTARRYDVGDGRSDNGVVLSSGTFVAGPK